MDGGGADDGDGDGDDVAVDVVEVTTIECVELAERNATRGDNGVIALAFAFAFALLLLLALLFAMPGNERGSVLGRCGGVVDVVVVVDAVVDAAAGAFGKMPYAPDGAVRYSLSS